MTDNKKEFLVDVAQDQSCVRITLGKEEIILTPAELDVVISELGKRRQALADPVPWKLDPNARMPQFVFNSPVMIGRPGEEKFGFIGLRHPGFGWMAYGFSPKDMRSIRDGCHAVAAAIEPIELPPAKQIIMPGK